MIIKTFFQSLLDFIYPNFCKNCQSPLTSHEVVYCDECWSALEIISEPYCHRCGAPLEEDKCQPGDFVFAEVRSLAKFDQQLLKDAIHLMKYNMIRSVGKYLGARLGEVLRETPAYQDVDAIVPVPLHSARFRERGYNQSKLIAEGISSVMNTKIMTNQLIRIKNTVSQTSLSREERQQNVHRAFVVKNPEMVNDKIILLVDDVLTTGSTLNSCAEAFISAGAKKVLAATIARA
jgi:ComF family protein